MDGAILVMRVKRGGAISRQIEEGRLIRVKTQKCTTRLGRVVGGCQVRVADGAWADQYPVISR